MALRKYPRRSVSYDYYGMTASQSQYLRALSYAKQNEQIEIPLWHAACRLTENAYANHSILHVTPQDLWQFRGCSGMIFWHNDTSGGERYFINVIHGDGSIQLTEVIERDYLSKQIAILPVSYGYLKPEDDYSSYTDSYVTMQLNVDLQSDYAKVYLPTLLDENHFETWETKTPFQNALPTSYAGVELFPLAPSWTKDVASNFTRNANALDNTSGIVKYDLKSINGSENKEIEYVLATRSEINNFQRFFTKCKGRWKSFYAPTWLSDMVLVEDVPKGQSYMMVDWSLYWKYYTSMVRRKLIVVFLKSGSVRTIRIAGYSTDETGKFGKVYLDSPTSAELLKKDVVMISFLCRYRFDSDTLTTEYDTTGIATISTAFTEVTI